MCRHFIRAKEQLMIFPSCVFLQVVKIAGAVHVWLENKWEQLYVLLYISPSFRNAPLLSWMERAGAESHLHQNILLLQLTTVSDPWTFL